MLMSDYTVRNCSNGDVLGSFSQLNTAYGFLLTQKTGTYAIFMGEEEMLEVFIE